MAEVATPTTRLEAVNSIIASVGEPPANELDTPSRQVVVLGLRAIDDASRIIQSKGWYWNTEEEVTLTADGDGYLYLASNVLRAKVNIQAWTSTTAKYAFLDQRIYDTKNRTFVFSAGTTLKVDQILLRPFEELPEPARYAIWARGGVLFQTRHYSGESLYSFTEGMARAAFASMLQDELQVKRWNLDESGALRDLVFRR